MTTAFRVLCILGIVQLLFTGVSAADMIYRYNAARTGDYSPVAGSPGTTVSELWNVSLPGHGSPSSTPAVVNGVIYLGNDYRDFFALNASSGTIRWVFRTRDGVETSPAVVNGVVYVGSEDKDIYAIHAATGTMKWNYTTRYNTFSTSSPVLVNGIVYAGSSDTSLYALNANSGAKIWNLTTGDYIFSSPAVVNGVVYVGSDDGHVYAANATTGALLWNYTTGSRVRSTPAVVNGIVYIGSNDGKIYAFNARSGTVKWSYTTGNAVVSSPAVANGIVYIGGLDGKLYALNASTGVLRWSYDTKGAGIVTSPIYAKGIIYFGDYDAPYRWEKVYALNAATGTQIWNYSVDSSVTAGPVIADGIVYAQTAEGTLYALDSRAKLPPTAAFAATPRTGTSPLTVRFADFSTNTPTSWQWTFGDGSAVNATKQNPVHTYTKAGNYTVKLKAANGYGNATATKAKFIVVSAPPPTINAVTPAAGVRGRTVIITNLSGTGFATGAKVFLNKTGCPLIQATDVKVIGANKIKGNFTIPANAALGRRNVEVRNTNGKIGVKTNAFTVMAAAAPTVTGITPKTARRGAYVVVTNLSGTGFVATPKPKVQLVKGASLVTATNVTVVSAKKITCTFRVPAGATLGTWNVRVTNGDNQAGGKAGAFTVTV